MTKKRPFRMDQYKTYEGEPGSPEQWKAAFNATMGAEEARTRVGKNTPEYILGVGIGAAWSVIVSAYRACVMATHPDRCAIHGLSVAEATEKFKQVIGAFTLLKLKYNK